MRIPIDRVKVKGRLREDLGDIDGLAESIKKWGLFHPIVIDDQNCLVVGERRLEACKRIGMKLIEARPFGELSDAERREIEIDENLRRKDLTAYERSKYTAELAEAAKRAAAEEEKRKRELPPDSGDKSKRGRGRPREGSSTAGASERTGVPEQTIRDAEAHVEAAERYPVLQGSDWSQAAAMKAAKVLDELPTPDRRKIISLVGESAPPAREAAKMIESFGRATPEARTKVHEMARSGDERDRSLALTFLAETAPEPDPRTIFFRGVARDARNQAKKFKGDPMNERIEKFACEAEEIAEAIQKIQKKRIETMTGGPK